MLYIGLIYFLHTYILFPIFKYYLGRDKDYKPNQQILLYYHFFISMIRLGRLALYHCHECNMPLLKKSYEGMEAKHVAITPPGDVRPAFDFDRKMIGDVIKKQFGSSYMPSVVLLNSVPAIDRSDEVIIDGKVAGNFFYDIFRQKFYFNARPWYASLIDINKGYVIADDGAIDSILKTSNLMAPGVKEVDEGIKAGDEVVVLSEGQVIATGRARMDGSKMIGNRGMAVKIRHRGMEAAEKGEKITWEQVIKANEDVINSYETKAKNFISNAIKKYGREAAISFSGGKDSLATLLLTMEAGYDLPLIFLNTGLEFDETIEHVYSVASHYGLNLIEEEAGNVFWRGIKFFGPPARDYRWCCKTCKMGPAVRLIKKNFSNGLLSFIGQRRYESENRARHGDTWFNPWVSNQIAVSPIQNWTALHIWLYLFMKKAKWNKLYEQGFYRIGCWLCPSSNMSDFKLKKHEDWQIFEKELKNFSLKHNLPEEWISLGLWRWRRKPKWSMIDYKIEEKREYKIKGNEERIKNFLKIIGDDEKIANIKIDENRIYAEKEKNLVEDVVYKAINCMGCGICLSKCPKDAIYIEKNKAWITDDCIHCRECMNECPVITFR